MAESSRTVLHILLRYLKKEDVQELCDDLGLPVDGSKEDLVARLVAESEFDPNDTLQYLDTEQLRELCLDWELDDSGTRDGLLEKISDAMAPASGSFSRMIILALPAVS